MGCKDEVICEARALARISGVVVYGDTTHGNERRWLIRAPKRRDKRNRRDANQVMIISVVEQG